MKIEKKTVPRPPRLTSPDIVAPAKRPAEGVKVTDKDLKNKKIKQEEENGGGSSSNPQTWKNPFEHIWSGHDELLIMKTMLDWRKKGKDPRADLGGVLAYMRDKLDTKAATAANESKLEGKLVRMKKKYRNNIQFAERDFKYAPENAVDPTLYYLMEEFFVGEEEVNSAAATNGKKPRGSKTNGKKPRGSKTKSVGETSSQELPKEVQEGLSSYPCLVEVLEELKNIPTGPRYLTEAEAVANLVPAQIREFENQCKKVKEEEKKVKEAEAQVYWKRVMLTSSILNALKSSSDS